MFFFASVVISPHQTVSVNPEATLKTRPISDYYIFFLDKLKSSVRIDRGKSVSTRDIGGFRRRLESFWRAREAIYEDSGGMAAAAASCQAFFC
jgi:hypothetical protein